MFQHPIYPIAVSLDPRFFWSFLLATVLQLEPTRLHRLETCRCRFVWGEPAFSPHTHSLLSLALAAIILSCSFSPSLLSIQPQRRFAPRHHQTSTTRFHQLPANPHRKPGLSPPARSSFCTSLQAHGSTLQSQPSLAATKTLFQHVTRGVTTLRLRV